MEFSIKKCNVIIMNRGKVKSKDGTERPSGEKVREMKLNEEDEYKYLGILEYDIVKVQEMKDKFRNEYFGRAKLILKSKLNERNKIMALNTWFVYIMNCDAGIHKWNKNKLQEINRNTRKCIIMIKELYPRSNVARLHVSSKNGGRGLIGYGNSVNSEENGLGRYAKNKIEPLLVASKTSRIVTHEETVDPKEFKKTKKEQRKNE